MFGVKLVLVALVGLGQKTCDGFPFLLPSSLSIFRSSHHHHHNGHGSCNTPSSSSQVYYHILLAQLGGSVRSDNEAQEDMTSTASTTATVAKGRRVNTRVREIMATILSHVDENDNNDKTQGKEWTKLKNYIYKSKNLTVNQVKEVLDFLTESKVMFCFYCGSSLSKFWGPFTYVVLYLVVAFPNNNQLVKSILQSVPRILRKNADTYLRPTCQFLIELYGPDLFLEVSILHEQTSFN